MASGIAALVDNPCPACVHVAGPSTTDIPKLSSVSGAPEARRVALSSGMTTAWCKTAVGRAIFKLIEDVSSNEVLISQRHANRVGEQQFWSSTSRRVLDTLADLPSDTASDAKIDNWMEPRVLGPDFRLELPRPEESQPGDVLDLVDVAIHHMKDQANVARDKVWHSKLSSASFRDELARFLVERYRAVEESSPNGSTTGEANADAESMTSRSASPTGSWTGDRTQVFAGIDADGEEEDGSQQESPAEQMYAPPPSSQTPPSPPSGRLNPPSARQIPENRVFSTRAGDTNLTAAHRPSASEANTRPKPGDWRKGPMARCNSSKSGS
ncbi:hypothetical protein E4U14_005155 [Claviceps sp. LM454 group G7]|nr:hypothetical protein E4U14_005155 [Claviceps sp. LM454 group G7]